MNVTLVLHMEWKKAPVDMVDEQRRCLYDSAARQTNDNVQLNLINLPDVCLEAILSNLSYDEISKYRIVRTSFNTREENSPSLPCMPQSVDLTRLLLRFADSLIGSARNCSTVASILWRSITRNASGPSRASCRGGSPSDGAILSHVIVIS